MLHMKAHIIIVPIQNPSESNTRKKKFPYNHWTMHTNILFAKNYSSHSGITHPECISRLFIHSVRFSSIFLSLSFCLSLFPFSCFSISSKLPPINPSTFHHPPVKMCSKLFSNCENVLVD